MLTAAPPTMASSPPPEPQHPPVSPPPPPRGAAIAMMIARTLQAPPKPEPAVLDALREPRVDASMIDVARNVCGLSVNQNDLPMRSPGPTINNIGGPSEVVQIGLAPKPGLAPDERHRVVQAIELVRRGARDCLPPLARKNGKLFAAPIAVTLNAAGGGAESSITLPKTVSPEVSTCITGAVRSGLALDEAAGHLTFTVRIDKAP